ncbi:hypothetical protein SAY87_021987 [Trapa incisa]|uniref:Uncharacterized protein n=1 Tax=Trapa incisa TaxID=236973 RepID=A0AAN7JSM5_9MYRT|nr:hypothetical protein SAY87_021987 [Trapa incisa]
MGGSSRSQKRASSSAPASFTSSFFKFFKPVNRRTAGCARDDSLADDAKVWPSDYDKGRYVAKPGIDNLATEFIAKFHESRVLESGTQTIKVSCMDEDGDYKPAN